MTEELEQFRQWLRLRNRSEATVRTYSKILGFYYDCGQDSLQFLTRAVSLATATKNSHKAALKALFRFRGEQPDIDQDLLQNVQPTNQYYQIIPRERVREIVHETRPHWNQRHFIPWRNHVMVELLAYCGLRPLELVSIRLRDIGPDNSIWIIGIKREDGGKVYPPARVFEDIQNLLRFGDYQSQDDRLFSLSPGRAGVIVKQLTGYRPKDFRTTFGTEVARQTKDPYMVQKLMRHKQMASAMPYVHLGAEYGRRIQEVRLYES